MIFLHVVYHCVGGSHSSVTAAAIHLNLLPEDHIPSVYDLLNVPFFDTLQKSDQGKVILRGTDTQGNKIYTLSRQFIPYLVIPAIKDMWRILGQKEEELLIVNTLPSVNLLMRIGGFSSRRLKWVRFGRPIVAKGTLGAYPDIVKIVQDTKQRLL